MLIPRSNNPRSWQLIAETFERLNKLVIEKRLDGEEARVLLARSLTPTMPDWDEPGELISRGGPIGAPAPRRLGVVHSIDGTEQGPIPPESR
jgi:hypothetical protein